VGLRIRGQKAADFSLISKANGSDPTTVANPRNCMQAFFADFIVGGLSKNKVQHRQLSKIDSKILGVLHDQEVSTILALATTSNASAISFTSASSVSTLAKDCW
jgi:hypothetical protein